MNGCFSKSRACGKECCLPQTGDAPLPLPRGLGGTSTAPAGASTVPAGTSTDNPAVGGSAPASRINSTAAPSARGDGGAGSHLSEVVRSPSLSFSSSDDEFANTAGGERPCCSRSRYSLLYQSSHSCRLIFFYFARARRGTLSLAAARHGQRPGPEASTGLSGRRVGSPAVDRDYQDE
jgi:hypothetical protein